MPQDSDGRLTENVANGTNVTPDRGNARNVAFRAAISGIFHTVASCTLASGSGEATESQIQRKRAMKLTRTTVRRGLFGVFASTALGAAVAATVAVPSASGAPAPCTAAGLSNTVSGVTAAAGQYLDAHPDVNDALTRAGTQTPAAAQGSLQSFFGTHPQEFQDLRGIARPLTDLRAACNQTVSPGQVAALLQAFAS
jgi:heme-binding protein